MVCTLLAGVNVVAFAADDNDLIVSVHSFYNDATKGGDGEHLFTKDESEMSWLSSLPTWNDEGEAWKAPVSSSLAVYRVYNPNSGEHHYAAADEASWLVGQGWTQEKIAFYSDDNMGVPVYRLWNGLDGVGSHYYTTDEGEAAWLASIGWQAEGVNFYGVKEEEPGEKEMTAVQTGAKEITVTTTTPFTGADEFTVSHGLIEDSIEDVDYDEDMCTIVITLDSNIIEDEYTVECSDEEYEPAYFDGEEAEVANLVFVDDQLVLSADGKEATVAYATVDQFGDPIADTVEFKAGTYEANWQAAGGKGKLTISNSGAAIAVGTKIPVAGVYANDTKVVNETFEVVATSVVANMMIMDLQPNPAYEDLVGERVTTERIAYEANPAANDKYLLGIIATDQYGNALDADALNTMLTNKSLYVTPNWNPYAGGAPTGVATAIPMFSNYDAIPGAVVLPVVGDDVNSGKGIINFLSTAGFSANKEVNVEQNEVIDVLNVEVGDLQVGKPVPTLIAAVDQYGDIVDYTDEDKYAITGLNDGTTLTFIRKDLDGGQTNVKATVECTYGSTFSLVDDNICITASDGAGAAKAEVIKVQTPTNKVNLLQKKVNASATPASVKGFVEGTNTVLSFDNQTIKIANYNDKASYTFIDSYGEVVNPAQLDTVFNGYTFTVTPVTQNYTKIVGNDIVIDDSKTAPKTAAADTYKATIIKNSDGSVVSSKNLTVTIAGEIKNYMAGFVETTTYKNVKTDLYVGDAYSDKAQLVVYGLDSKNNMVRLADGFTAALDNENVDTAKLTCSSGGQVSVATQVALPVMVESEATVIVYRNGEVVTTATLDCSNELPEALYIMAFKDNKIADVSSGISAVTTSPATLDNSVVYNVDVVSIGGYTFVAFDQYGNAIDIDYATLGGDELDNASTVDFAAGKTIVLNMAADEITQKINVTVLPNA